MITKHYCKSIVRAALLLTLTMCVTGLAPSARAGSYSINDVSGVYVFHGDGWTVGLGKNDPPFPTCYVGLVTFTPATGTVHLDLIVRQYGTQFEGIRDGTYTVDPTGHGILTWLSATGAVKQIDFYIVKGGAELKWINTDPPGTVDLSKSGTMTKQ
jgi:hypothetical protein